MRYLTGRSFRKKNLFFLTVSDDSVHHGRGVHVIKEGVRGPLFHDKPGNKECKPRMRDFLSPSKACPQKSVPQAQLPKGSTTSQSTHSKHQLIELNCIKNGKDRTHSRQNQGVGGESSNRKDSEDRRGCPAASQHADALCCASDDEAVRHGGTRTFK